MADYKDPGTLTGSVSGAVVCELVDEEPSAEDNSRFDQILERVEGVLCLPRRISDDDWEPMLKTILKCFRDCGRQLPYCLDDMLVSLNFVNLEDPENEGFITQVLYMPDTGIVQLGLHCLCELALCGSEIPKQYCSKLPVAIARLVRNPHLMLPSVALLLNAVDSRSDFCLEIVQNKFLRNIAELSTEIFDVMHLSILMEFISEVIFRLDISKLSEKEQIKNFRALESAVSRFFSQSALMTDRELVYLRTNRDMVYLKTSRDVMMPVLRIVDMLIVKYPVEMKEDFLNDPNVINHLQDLTKNPDRNLPSLCQVYGATLRLWNRIFQVYSEDFLPSVFDDLAVILMNHFHDEPGEEECDLPREKILFLLSNLTTSRRIAGNLMAGFEADRRPLQELFDKADTCTCNEKEHMFIIIIHVMEHWTSEIMEYFDQFWEWMIDAFDLLEACKSRIYKVWFLSALNAFLSIHMDAFREQFEDDVDIFMSPLVTVEDDDDEEISSCAKYIIMTYFSELI